MESLVLASVFTAQLPGCLREHSRRRDGNLEDCKREGIRISDVIQSLLKKKKAGNKTKQIYQKSTKAKLTKYDSYI